MAQEKDTTNLSRMLFQFMGTADPMLNMLDWLCRQMMEAEISCKIGADKSMSKAKKEPVIVVNSNRDAWISG